MPAPKEKSFVSEFVWRITLPSWTQSPLMALNAMASLASGWVIVAAAVAVTSTVTGVTTVSVIGAAAATVTGVLATAARSSTSTLEKAAVLCVVVRPK